MSTHDTPCPVLDTSPQPVRSGQYPAPTDQAAITPSCGFQQSPSPDQLKQTLFCRNGERGVFLKPDSFHIVYFIKGLTSSPISKGCIKWSLDLRRFWTPDAQLSDKQPIFLKENMRGVGKSKEVGNKQRLGFKGWREGLLTA